jgi:hypothetical protein
MWVFLPSSVSHGVTCPTATDACRSHRDSTGIQWSKNISAVPKCKCKIAESLNLCLIPSDSESLHSRHYTQIYEYLLPLHDYWDITHPRNTEGFLAGMFHTCLINWLRVNWIPVSTAWLVLKLQTERPAHLEVSSEYIEEAVSDGGQGVDPPAWVLSKVLTTPHPKDVWCYAIFARPRACTVTLVRYKQWKRNIRFEIELADGRDRWRALVNVVMKFRFHKMWEFFD